MDQLEEIRSKIDLVQFVSESVPLKKAGRNFKGLCPFHTEKTPSFIVSPERQIWKCFGCNRGGDVFRFLMETERIEFGEALRILAKRVGIVLQSYRPTHTEEEKERLYQVNHLSSEFFHYLLLKHPIGKKALDYILQRGISKESLTLFKLGYSPPMWEGLQKYLVGKKGYPAETLEKAGLIIASSRQPTADSRKQLAVSRHYDRFRDRLMFPLVDHRGNITGFSGRVLDPAVKNLPAGRQEPKYINTPETLIYHKSELLYPLNITKEEIKKQNQAMVVEGELDTISSYQAGIKNVVAIKGSALTEEQAKLLKRFCEDIILSLDSDTAGDMASRRGIEIAEKTGLNLKVLTLEKYKDPDEAAQKEPRYLKQRYQQAVNVYDFFIDSAFKRFGGKTAEEKKKIGQEIVPLLVKIEDEIVKNVYIQKLAQRLEVNEESVILQAEKVKNREPWFKKGPVSPVRKPRKEILEEYLLSLIFQGKKTGLLLDDLIRELFSSPVYLKIIEQFRKYSEEENKFSSQFFYNFLPVELRVSFDKLYLTDFGETLDDGSWLDRELARTQKQLRLLTLKEILKQEMEKLRYEEGKEPGASKETQARIKKLFEELGGWERTS